MRGVWDPRRALRERTDVLLRFDLLDGDLMGTCETHGGHTIITLDSRLDERERLSVLGHELIHSERGGSIDYFGAAKCWSAIVAREERIVDREVARRMVPAEQLESFLAACADLGEAVTADDIADAFGVARWVAADAMRWRVA